MQTSITRTSIAALPVRHMSPRRSTSRQENDERLLDAALDEIAAVGVDRLAMSSVARRAGLTTGALYGRYENAGELLAAVWIARVRAPHFDFLDRAIRRLVDGDESLPLEASAQEIAAPTRTTFAALELLTTARRVDELEEVVTPDLEAWMRGWGAAPRVRDRRRRAQIVLTLGSVWGMILHAIPRRRPVDWEAVLAGVGRSFARPYVEPTDHFVADRVRPVRAANGDAAQNALIDAVSAIAARVGFDRATTSRIARRAGLTSGAIYARYETKDALLADAVETLLAQRFADDLVANDYLFTAPDVGAATARVIGGYLSPPRREWRSFRIEAQIASRHRPLVATTLDDVQETAIREYLDALGAHTAEEKQVLDGLARYAHLLPLGLAFVELVAPATTNIDWRHVLVPLLVPELF